jgi:hypothetical protein
MDIRIDVRGIEEVKAALNRIPEAARGRAMAQALKRTAEKGRTMIDRAIRDEYLIPRERILNSIETSRSGSYEGGTLTASIDIWGSSSKRGRSANIIRYMEKSVTLAEARRRAKAGTLAKLHKGRKLPILRFRFRKGGGVKTVAGAFVGNKGRTVFRRIGPGRLPIEAIQIIDLPQMFTATKIKRPVLQGIERVLVEEAERAVRFALSRGA